jgi:hypothetical protein
VPIDVRDVNRSLRLGLWPTLRRQGFDQRTQRVAWRRREDGVDVVEIQSVGSFYDSIGCTSFSFSAMVASLNYWAISPYSQPEGKARFKPHYWQCEPFVRPLNKSLNQPWFRPFTHTPANLPEPMQLHQDALKLVLRTDVHDRPDIWFVLEDGTNLDQVLRDLTEVVHAVGLPVLEKFHDPEQVVQMAATGDLHTRPGSPVAQQVTQAALAILGRR